MCRRPEAARLVIQQGGVWTQVSLLDLRDFNLRFLIGVDVKRNASGKTTQEFGVAERNIEAAKSIRNVIAGGERAEAELMLADSSCRPNQSGTSGAGELRDDDDNRGVHRIGVRGC